MRKIFFILIIGLNVTSCTFSQEESGKIDALNIIDKLLKRDNYNIPDSLFSFFPDKSDKYKHLVVYSIFHNAEKSKTSLKLRDFDAIKLVEVYQCDNEDFFRQIINNYRSQSFFSVKAENKDYFVIGSEGELFMRFDTLQLKEQYAKIENNRLIFHFGDAFENDEFLYDSTTICGLPTGYEILVLKSGSDFVLPLKYIDGWSILPESIRHGYRSGVAFKEGEPYIIYWTVAW